MIAGSRKFATRGFSRFMASGAQKRVCATATPSKPGFGFVLAVLVAEVGFEDARFGASAHDLQRNDDEKDEQVVRPVEKEEEPEHHHCAENVCGNRVRA